MPSVSLIYIVKKNKSTLWIIENGFSRSKEVILIIFNIIIFPIQVSGEVFGHKKCLNSLSTAANLAAQSSNAVASQQTQSNKSGLRVKKIK